MGLTHHFTRKREERAAAAKQASERLYIATELVFLLEQFAEGSTLVAADSGEQDKDGITVPTETQPDIELTLVKGDWQVLPAKLIYRIRELPMLRAEAGKYVASAYENSWPPDYSPTFQERQYQYSRLGLKALFAAIRLLEVAGLPSTRLNATSWSAQPELWRVWRQARGRLSVLVRQQQTLAQMNVALQQSIKNNSQSGRTP
ncbi:hypothetical protein FRI63_08300 [Salmonella enterica]|uniref:hypothetical protein n=1 Tax=Enterobacteriaceae TaxID=543 RepID=UPI000CFBA826|nr:hypothetical protein [Klebsiella pneumoniae]ECH4533797.1 hypothetical protein [Salmonella enterica]EET6928415.1 hypothetical protein [Escherichia coli]ECK4366601.1 hypothetical protein [Salmonella enterica]EKU0819753.1 hypothetical protein [Klebsiella pneumoniae]RNY32338.1 hypothetical protein C5Y00_023980 [Klebsiella pneumoniae subsp. pneumoniae]